MQYDDWMNASDAILWHMERDPILRSTISAVFVFDRAPDESRFRESLAETVRQIPRLSQRVVADQLGVAPPRWVEVDDFELGDHVHIEDLAHGTEADVLELAGRLHSIPFDRERPLWDLHLLNGLTGGRSAMILKLHHTIADGVGFVRMASSFLQLERDAPPTTATGSPAGAGGDGRSLDTGLTLVDAIARRAAADAGIAVAAGTAAARNLPKIVLNPFAQARGAAQTAASIARTLKPAREPKSPVMRNRSVEFVLASTERPLERLRAAAHECDVTINDVFVTAVVGGVQRYHELHGQRSEELRLAMPISVRADDDDVAGNQFVPARFLVPSDIADPRERVRDLSQRLRAERSEPGLPHVSQVAEIVNRLGPTASTAVLAGMMKAADVTTSNVPGAPFTLYMAGSRIVRLVPFGPCAGAAVNITLLSLDGTAYFGLNMDRAAIPDHPEFAAAFEASLDEVLELAP